MIDVAHRLAKPGAALRGVVNLAVEREFARLTGEGQIVEDCVGIAAGDIMRQGKMPAGISVQDGAKRAIIRRCRFERFREAISGEKYDNGDGIKADDATETWITDCVTNWNRDGGIDSKDPLARITNHTAIGNRYNLRLWANTVLDGFLLTGNPEIAHMQIVGNDDNPPVIDLRKAAWLTFGTKRPLVNITKGAAIIPAFNAGGAGVSKKMTFSDGGKLYNS